MKTIRSKILLSFCLLLISFGAVFSMIYYYNLRSEIISGFDERLLVVDDDEDVRSLYTDVLRDLGYTVLEAEDGADALVLLHGDPVGLVVLDVNMPRMDGRETFRRIRLIDSRMPVLITSGLADLNDGQFSPDDHLRVLSKPLRIESMAQTVRELLDA